VKLVLTIVARDAADLLDAHLAFHLNAGVDFVIAVDPGSADGTTVILESYARAGHLRRIPAQEAGHEHVWPTEMARLAVVEYGADWVIPSNADEFWWPRGESLKDVLAVIPPRYAVVQALVRTFARRRHEGQFFADEMTVRTSLLGPEGSAGEPQRMLRPVHRAEPNMVVDPESWTLAGRRVPLRAWYPIEVFHFAGRFSDPVDDSQLGDLIADGTLVVDTRLRDVLHNLRDAAGDAGVSSFALPVAGTSHITLPVPNIADDASYAVECAAVGEVDLVRLDAQIRELELRIATLEARFWPRVQRTVRRLGRRRR
jgi:hypothetical protein